MAAKIYTPEELFQAAQFDRKLKPKERRAVILWLERTGEVHNWDHGKLAHLLGVRPGKFEKLRQEAQHLIAAVISPDQAMNFMGEYLRHTDMVIREALAALKDAHQPGGIAKTQLHQGYMRLLLEASGEKISKLQSIGVIPKELGRLTAVSEEWTATIEDGVATCRSTTGESGDPA